MWLFERSVRALVRADPLSLLGSTGCNAGNATALAIRTACVMLAAGFMLFLLFL